MSKRILTIYILATISLLSAGEEIRSYQVNIPMCTSLYTDSRGIVLIGTWDGLYEYDGTTVQRKSASLSSNVVYGIRETKPGTIWLLTYYGLNRLNINTLETHKYIESPGEDWDYLGCSIDVSSEGLLFHSSPSHISYYREEADSLDIIKGLAFGDEVIKKICCPSEGKLFVFTSSDKVYSISYDISSDGTVCISDKSLLMDDISDYFPAESGKPICFKNNNDILVFHNGAFISTVAIPKDAKVVSGATMRGDGSVFVADRDHIWKIDPSDNSTELISDQYYKISNLYCGPQNTVYAVTEEQGVIEFYPRSHNYKIITDENGQAQNIRITQKGHSGTILAGTDDGLYLLDGNVLRKCPPAKNAAKWEYFRMASPLKNGDFVISFANGLGIVTAKKGRKTAYQELVPGNMFANGIYVDENAKEIWAASFTMGLVKIKYDENNGKYSLVEMKEIPAAVNSDGPSARIGMCVKPDKDGRHIWYGSMMGGMARYDRVEEKYEEQGPSEMKKLKAYNVMDFCYIPDETSTLWASTTEGMRTISVNPDGSFTIDAMKDGIKQDYLPGKMTLDGNGRIWTTKEGYIHSIDPKLGKESSFNILNNSIYNSLTYTDDGKMLIGSSSGLVEFTPDELSDYSFSPDLVIRGVSANGEKKLLEGESLTLKHNENFFTIEFVALNFNKDLQMEYSYKLDGLNEIWSDFSVVNKASFTKVPPGNYTFRLKSTNGEGEENENELGLKIRILQPWWNTIAARIGFLTTFVILLTGMAFLQKKKRREKAEKKKMESLLKQKEDIFEAKLDFFTNVAHEFETPLSLISSTTSKLGETADKRSIKEINSNVDKMQSLIQELAGFRKADTGKYIPRYTVFNVSSLLNDIYSSFKKKASGRGINMELSLPEKAMAVASDYDALDKIFSNLISNALRSTPDGGAIDIMLKNEGLIHFTVSNTGEGIDRKDIDKLFDKFEIIGGLESNEVSSKAARNSLALGLTHSLITALNGNITVSSEKGKFTAFSAEIPFGNLPVQNDADEVDEVRQEPVFIQGRKTILVAENDRLTRQIVEDCMEDTYNVVCAADGKEALSKLKEITPDLIIASKTMPRMDGLELTSVIKSDDILKVIPIILTAFKSSEEEETKYYEMGIESYVSKPFQPKTIRAIADRIIKTRTELRSFYNSSVSNTELFKGRQISSEDKSFVLKLVQIIEENIQNNELSPAYLADKMNVSDVKLYRKIKEIVEMTSVEFIRYVRMTYASSLLKTSSLTIQEVMFKSGFNNRAYFHKKFSELFGMTPSKYREVNKKY